MRILFVTAVDAEREAVGRLEDATVIAGGIGRTNAACATTETIIRRGPYDAVVSAGIAGALPGAELAPGDTVVASACVYAEEGLRTLAGFSDIESIGCALGDFTGNAVPVDPDLLDVLAAVFRIGPIATVATCSGTDAAAAEIAARTNALAEAMEGAAVVHAARRLHVPAIEIRTISNLTGDRQSQLWDLPGSLSALGEAVRRATRSCTVGKSPHPGRPPILRDRASARLSGGAASRLPLKRFWRDRRLNPEVPRVD